MLREVFKASVRLIAKDYWNGWLYATRPPQSQPVGGEVTCAAIERIEELRDSRYAELQKQAWTREEDAWAFGAWVDGELVGVCWIQARETHRRRGGQLDLADDEAELAQITTAQSFRGRGVASKLIQYAGWQMGLCGFRKLYAKIWHDNTASVRAFERAGWRLEKRFFSLRIRGTHKSVIFRLPVAINTMR